MPLQWRQCLRHFHYHIIAYLCCKIENMVYTKKDRILYKWVPQSCDVMLYDYLVRPKVYPFSDRIFHLMVFMRVYRGKCTYTTWNYLYTQYLSKYWITYYCVRLWCSLLLLESYEKISCLRKRREKNPQTTKHQVWSKVRVVSHRMQKHKESLLLKPGKS